MANIVLTGRRAFLNGLDFPGDFHAPCPTRGDGVVASWFPGQANVFGTLESCLQSTIKEFFGGSLFLQGYGALVPSIAKGIVHDDPVLLLIFVALHLLRLFLFLFFFALALEGQIRITIFRCGVLASKAILAAFLVLRITFTGILTAISAVVVTELCIVASVHIIMADSISQPVLLHTVPLALGQGRTVDKAFLLLWRFHFTPAVFLIPDDTGIKRATKGANRPLVSREFVTMPSVVEKGHDIGTLRVG
jgi:hypothetical protein